MIWQTMNGNMSREEIFRQMNEAVNEFDGSVEDQEEDTSLSSISMEEEEGQEEEVEGTTLPSISMEEETSISMNSVSASPVKEIKVLVKQAAKQTPENVSKGSWRFSSEPSSSGEPIKVRVKNSMATRKMVLGEGCDMMKIQVKPLVKTSRKLKPEIMINNVSTKTEDRKDLLVK